MTTSRKTANFFVAGGALRPNAPSYVERPADNELFELARAGEFAYVLTARQLGKSSLMHRTARRLKKEGIRSVRIDLTNIGTVSVEKWYLGVLVELSRQLRLAIDPNTWWDERSWQGTVQRFSIFLRDVVLSEIQEPIVIFIDEIDFTLGLDFSDDFFAAIRSLYNARAQDTTFERLTFVLLGVASPSDLIKDRTKTPFNIGQGILLQDFSGNDAAPLQTGLVEEYPHQGEAIFTRIYYWTDGHPYLTQKLCQEVVKSEKQSWTKGQIDELVEETFFSDWSRKDDNLKFVQDQILTASWYDRLKLLRLYRKVYQGKEVADDAQSLLQNELKLSGLVKTENGDLRVRNEIYRRVFGLAWVRENTPVDRGGGWGWGLAAFLFIVLLLVMWTQNISSKGTITVGSKDFTEQKLLREMLILKLEEAGYDVVDKGELGGTEEVRAALESGEIDGYWEYTGTALSDIHQKNVSALPTEPERAFALAQSEDEPAFVWLNRANFNNTYTLVVQQSTAEQGITTLEELADFMNDNEEVLKLCVEKEFLDREQDGLLPLQEHYGFAFKEENIEVVELANRLQNYEKLLSGECDVAEGFGTDGQIEAWGVHRLEDTLQFFPAYNPAPVIRQEVLDQYPELADLLGEIGPSLGETKMRKLNACLDFGIDGVPNSGDEESVEKVASRFIETGEIACSPPKIVVGSKLFTEQLLLGKMLVLMLKEARYDVVDQTGLGDTQEVRAALESGEIDLYWEYTGTALADIHGFQLRADPNEAFDLAKQLDEPLLVWLNRANFNNTYTLLVRQSTVAELGIVTLEDLANYMNANDAPLTLCVEQEFLEREQDGLLPLQAHYGFAFKKENRIEQEAQNIAPNYKGLGEGEPKCDVAEGYMTDARAVAWEFHQLTDTLDFFPPYNPAPVIRQEVLEEQPELEALLGQIGPRLDQATMTRLNEQVDIGDDGELDTGDEESPETVARIFLCEVGLLKQNCPLPESPPQCQDIVLNGGFESDEDWELPEMAWPAGYSTEKFHSGTRALRLGIINRSDDRFSQSVARQPLTITIPSDVKSATLSYWYYPISNNLSDGDEQGALIYNADLTFIRRKLLDEHSNEEAWIRQDHDLSGFIGEEVYIYFNVDNDGNGQPSAMYLDDVSLQVCWE